MDSPSSSPRATPWTTQLIFVIIWGVLHGALLLALVISSFLWVITAPILLLLSYALVFGWYPPAAWTSAVWTWALALCGGGGLWMGVVTMVDTNIVITFTLLGLITGLTTLPILPWRGVRTAAWPFINLLGTSAAAWIAPTFHGWGPSHDDFAGYVMAGAFYGLVTGPALAFFLHDAPEVRDAW
jgi:hypothetical protein